MASVVGRSVIGLLLLGAADAAGAGEVEAAAGGDLMQGKTRTGRSIDLLVVVDGTPEQLFDLWTTRDGVNDFFGTDANIDPRVGGLYEIRFGVRPDGLVAGPRENRILRFEPGRALSFEWEMPVFDEQLNTRPLPTWVEVTFDSYAEEPPQTQVRFSHLGFGTGREWDRSYEYFERNWFEVLFRLRLHCALF